jgi:MSHA biogenesis protein MshJ
MEAIRKYLARIDELSLRERAILMGGILVILFLGWYTWLMEPLIKEETALQAQLTSKRNQLQLLNTQFEQLSRRQHTDPDDAGRQRLGELRRQFAQVEQELLQATVNLVPPEIMPDILQQVLNRSQGLSLIRLQGLGGTPLIANANDGVPATDQPGPATGSNLVTAYKHGMLIEFRGDYLNTLNYINALEDMEWGFLWDTIDYRVTAYPEAIITLKLYTLSLNKHWITI